ncbi:hypothetical protein FRC11_013679, partial [Ceratobasidium sp. 423]
MEELLVASKLLRGCLDRYIKACSAVTTSKNPTDERDCNSSLLSGIRHELQNVASYEKDLKSAKSILARGRNFSPALVPISALPPDVL